MDNNNTSTQTIANLYGLDGKKLQRQYRDYLSEFKDWEYLEQSTKWLVYPQNIGKRLSIDEIALSQGELYTVVTNKKAKGRAGSIVAIISGTKSEEVIKYLKKIPEGKRRLVEEITLDMAGSMKLIAKKSFPRAVQVIDRFHVQQLASDAVQDIRVKYRWQALELENEAIKTAKNNNYQYRAEVFSNGDTRKQLLARSRYLLFKSPDKWTSSQKERAGILFMQYPMIKEAYDLSNQLRVIYNTCTDKNIAMTKLALWYNQIENSGFKSFRVVMNTISLNYRGILNYFDNRITNAAAESFNAKIKAFRQQLRGVRNKEFFLFRLAQIYA
ncbi:DDE transposase [Tamlana carrageenivorans]|uniref:DDE transposase n=1 Tax=Pseudotamlana carrageenivorans TaxID=2069432 RepID=A0A2I7SH92_9FLAO|nr:DDE transposase [Tamlana carrageenivorans]AUS07180.1 DDE transposase [Tamlana carrageenivorans]